jgi:hypothetical protein
MGMFATIRVDNEIELPHFPEEIDRDDMAWQSKQGLDVYSGPYRITAEGRLEQKKVSHREKTDEEKAEEADKWGFDSWDEMKQVYDEADNSMGYPDEIEYDADEDGYEHSPPLLLSERTTDETWWADISHHGTFEFHQYLKRDPTEYETHDLPDGGNTVEIPEEHALEVFLEYEARFRQGDLTDLVFMGERHTNVDDPIGEALDKIEEWREWKESQDEQP